MADSIWAGMYRFELPDGTLSDMGNLSRINDALFNVRECRRLVGRENARIAAAIGTATAAAFAFGVTA